MMKMLCLFFPLLLATTTTATTEYQPGTINLVISAPHGGLVDLPGCPPRKHGCYDGNSCHYDSLADCTRSSSKCRAVFLPDLRTADVAEMVADAIEATGIGRPHLVILRSRRRTIDANRDIEQGCQGCPECEEEYHEFHDTLASVVNGMNGRGLLVDIHGQAHKKNSSEIGYLLSKSAIDTAVANNQDPTGTTSIESLLASSGIGRLQLLTGDQSLGKYLQDEGFDAIPSPTLPVAGETDYKYFRGGYILRSYGSLDPADLTDAIQVEAPSEVRYGGGKTMRKAYSAALGKAISNFWSTHYAS